MYDQGDFKNYVGGTIQDWKVSKPYGMKDDRFEASLEGMYRVIAKNNGVPVSELKRLRLRRAGVGKRTKSIAYELINERGIPLYSGVMAEGVTK